MVRIAAKVLLTFVLLAGPSGFSQNDGDPQHETTPLFETRDPLPISIRASIRSLKRDTNDSTYLDGTLSFGSPGASDSVSMRLRARGNFRRTQCYFAPVKLKFRKKDVAGTVFDGHHELKLVLPCLMGSGADDLVLKEYLAYRIYEILSPYYYKTRPVRVTFNEIRGKREKTHELLGFLIEDHGTLARRYGGKRLRQTVAPQMQDEVHSATLNLFQYLIGHTDFSMRELHNIRLYYISERYVSIPYDFDMAGLVDAPYATVSNTQRLGGSIGSVRQRIYKGYRRPDSVMQEVRAQFLEKRAEVFELLESLEPLFRDGSDYGKTRNYLESGFEVLEDDRQFERHILGGMRD